MVCCGVALRLPGVTHAALRFEDPVEEFFCEDRLRPSVQGYASWEKQLAVAALPMLNRPATR